MILVQIMSITDEDDRAFMLKLYQDYYALVRQTVYRIMLNDNDLDDLAEDVFLKLIGKIALLRTLDCCRTASYIVYTAKSVAINFIKHRNVQQKHAYYGGDEDVLDELAAREESLEDVCLHRETLESMSNAVLRLPERQKDILYFKYVLEQSDVEIAEELSIRPDSVREYLTRARRAAKKLMEKEDTQNGGSKH